MNGIMFETKWVFEECETRVAGYIHHDSSLDGGKYKNLLFPDKYTEEHNIVINNVCIGGKIRLHHFL